MLRLNNPKGAFTAAGSRLSIRRKAGPMGQLAVVRFCRGPRGRAWRPTRSLAGARYSQNRWREREMIRTYGPPGQRGLPSRKILIRHVLRNASAPALTVLGMQFVGLLGGAVIVEQIFGLPGIGSMAVKYTTRGDIPIIMGLVMVTVIGVIIINLLVDIVIGWLNPKARVA